MKSITVFFIFFFILLNTANAGVIIGGTRVIYPEGKKDVSISVENPDNIPYLIQSWIENANEGKQTDFTITPPLFRLNQEKTNTLRVFLTQNTLPKDRESLFWLNIKTIPATEKKSENSLKIAFKTQMKLIYRPESLANVDFNEEQKKLKWSKNSESITVKNPTSYYMNFQTIQFNGKSAENISYVAPFSEKTFNINRSESHGTITWEVINDYGSANNLAEIKI